jgi:hypothetical protein
MDYLDLPVRFSYSLDRKASSIGQGINPKKEEIWRLDKEPGSLKLS